MRKTLTLAVLCAAFGFVLGRSSRGHARTDALALESVVTIERPTGRELAPGGVGIAAVPEYESVPLRVSRVIESGATKSVGAGGAPPWRLQVGPTTYVLTP